MASRRLGWATFRKSIRCGVPDWEETDAVRQDNPAGAEGTRLLPSQSGRERSVGVRTISLRNRFKRLFCYSLVVLSKAPIMNLVAELVIMAIFRLHEP